MCKEQCGREATGWRRKESVRTRKKSDRWQIVRGRTLVLMGVWIAKTLNVSELWIKVSGGRMEKVVSVN